jgi:hypothetical protein
MKLNHGDVIWVTQLGAGRIFEIRTAEGFAGEYGVDAKALVASNIKEGRPLADALGIPVVGYDAALEIQNRRGRQVAFGTEIDLEGRRYVVHQRAEGYDWDEVELVPVG